MSNATDPLSGHSCPVRKCGGQLRVVERHVQQGTGNTAVTVECDRKSDAHRWFLVGNNPPGKHNRFAPRRRR